MILTRLVILLCGLLFSSLLDTVTAQSANANKTFVSSQVLFANPERGWIAHRFSNDWWGIEDLRNSAEKVSLVLVKIDISPYVNSTHVGTNKLNEIRAALNSCRSQGLKAILRSAYAWIEKLAPEPKGIATVLNHVTDMQPIYYEYADTILAVEMGMFGPWGEMHSSYYSTVNTQPYYPIATNHLKQVHSAYMSALPTTHSVVVRTPYYIRQIVGDDKPLTAAEAYGTSAKARTGYHNDAYLNSADDAGTFSYGWSRAQELSYVNQMTFYTFFGGETFGTPNGPYNNANNAILESKQQHMTYLNRDYYTPIYDAWGTTVKENFTRGLGYRLELKSLSYSQRVPPGGVLSFSLKLQNSGFAALHLKRPVNLILTNGKNGSGYVKYQTTLSVDPRTWTPEAGLISIDRNLQIPATVAEGIWQLFLAMPDSSMRLQADERYAVRFANEYVWSANGTNLLVNSISITAAATGARTNSTVFQETNATTAPPSSISQMSAVKTADSLNLSATFDRSYSFYQALVDCDNNLATGYRVAGIGADVLIENNRGYNYKGTSGTDWAWQPFSGTISLSINGYRYMWRAPIASLSKPIQASSKVVFSGTGGTQDKYSPVISVTIVNK